MYCQASDPVWFRHRYLWRPESQRAGLAPRLLPTASWLPALSCPLWAVGGVSEFRAYKQKLFVFILKSLAQIFICEWLPLLVRTAVFRCRGSG